MTTPYWACHPKNLEFSDCSCSCCLPTGSVTKKSRIPRLQLQPCRLPTGPASQNLELPDCSGLGDTTWEDPRLRHLQTYRQAWPIHLWSLSVTAARDGEMDISGHSKYLQSDALSSCSFTTWSLTVLRFGVKSKNSLGKLT